MRDRGIASPTAQDDDRLFEASLRPRKLDEFTGQSKLKENLAIAERRNSRWQMDSVLARFPGLKERLHHKGRELSGGEQEMLAIARALMTGPDLLLLDEPSQGLAPLVVSAVMETVRELKRQRVSMLLVEQNAEMALQLADRVYVIDHGTVVFEGTPAGLRADADITSTYLGVGG